MAHDRSMRMIWKTLRLRHIGLAFFWACSMLTFRSSILLSGQVDTIVSHTTVVMVSFICNMTTLFYIAARMERDPGYYDKLPAGLFTASIMVGLVLLSVAGSFDATLAMAVLLLGSLFTGVGYGYFWGSWAEYLGRMHPARTSFYIPVVFLATAVIFVVFSIGSDLLGLPALALMLPLPILSLFCLKRCKVEVPDGHYAPSSGSNRYQTALSSLVTLIIASMVLSFLFGFVWEMTVQSIGSVNQAHQLPLAANVIAALVLIAFVVCLRKRIEFSFAFKVVVPVIIVLFAVMPFFWDTTPVVLNLVMSTCYGMFDVIIWYMVASTSYDFAVSGFVIGGVVRAISILTRLIGIGVGYLVMLVPGEPSFLIIAISVGAIYMLAMLGLFYHTWNKKGSHLRTSRPRPPDDSSSDGSPAGSDERESPVPVIAEAESGDSSAACAEPVDESRTGDVSALGAEAPLKPDGAEQNAESVYEQIADYYGLTRREAEVLPYLARGRSAKVIAEALFVSESTIRTHTRRILEKTALHSKQELIDLIERYC